jgi:hypothetical protein
MEEIMGGGRNEHVSSRRRARQENIGAETAKTQTNIGGTGTTGNNGTSKEHVSSQNSAGRSEDTGAGNEE